MPAAVCHGSRDATSAIVNYTAELQIPKIIHQSWKTCTVPNQQRAWQEHCERVHGQEWKHWLWTDEDNRQFIAEKYPDFLPTCAPCVSEMAEARILV